MRHITPSKPDYWRGTAVAGASFTREQTEAMRAKRSTMSNNQHRMNLPAVYEVRFPAPRPTWQDKTDPVAPKFLCPVVTCTRDRKRLCIIAPNGMETWVPWRKGT